MTLDGGRTGGLTHWSAWHDSYSDAGSELSARLAVVRAEIRAALADHAGLTSRHRQAEPLTVLSACAGDGRDILAVLAEQDERPEQAKPGEHDEPGRRVQVTLLETDPDNLARAERFCREAGLSGVRLRDADAGESSSYLGAAPADLVLLCGVLGNIADADVRRLIAFLPRLCRPRATVIWTRTRRAPDLTPSIRNWLAATGFAELSFTAPPDVLFSIGRHRFDGEPLPLLAGRRLFSFLR